MKLKILIGILVVVLWVASALVTATLRVDPSVTALLPQDLPSVATARSISELKKDKNYMFALYAFDDPQTNPAVMDDLAINLKRLYGVDDVIVRREPATPYHLRLLTKGKLRELEDKVGRYIERKKLSRAGLLIDIVDEGDEVGRLNMLGEEYLRSKDKRYYLAEIVFINERMRSKEFDRLLRNIKKRSKGILGDVDVQFSGGKFNRHREQRVLMKDLTSTLEICIVLISFVMIFFMRSLAKFLYVIIPLAFGLTVTFALAALTVGSLNLQTIFIGVVLAGIGIDFGIHLAFKGMGRTTVRSLLMACATTACAYLVIIFSSMPGIRALGFIAAAGVAIILGSYLLLYRLFPLSKEESVVYPVAGKRLHYVRLLSGIIFVIVLAGISSSYFLNYETDMTNIASNQRMSEEPARKKVNEIKGGNGIHAVALLPDIDSAKVFDEKLADIAENGAVQGYMSLGSLLKADPAKEEIIERVRRMLLVENKRYMNGALIKKLEGVFDKPSYQLEDVPQDIKDRLYYNEETGISIGSIEAPGGMTEDEGMIRKFRSVSSGVLIDGKPINPVHDLLLMSEVNGRIKKELPLLVMGAALVILVILIISFRRIDYALLTIVPLAGGMGMLVIAMAVFGIKVNPFNLSILPILVGIGIDDGIYIVNQARASTPYRALKETFRAVTLTSLTSAIGFGSLIAAGNRGLVSVGIVGLIGIAAVWLCTVLFLPALLELYGRVLARLKSGHAKGWLVKHLLSLLLTAVGVCSLTWLIYKAGFASIADSIIKVRWYLAVLVMLAAAWNFLRGVSWWNFFAVRRKRYLSKTFMLSCAAEGLSHVLPFGSITSEAVRVKGTRGMPGSIAAIVVDKFNFYLSTFIFFVATLMTMIASGHDFSLPVIDSSHIIIGVTIGTVIVVLGKLFGRKLIAKIPFDQIRRVKGHRFASSLALNLAVRVLKTIEPILVLFILGVHLDPAQVLLMSSLMVASITVVGILPTQVGTKEMGFVAVMHLVGVPLEIAMSVIVIQKLRELLFAAFGLAVWATGTRIVGLSKCRTGCSTIGRF